MTTVNLSILKITLKSCDLPSSSWISVAWYYYLVFLKNTHWTYVKRSRCLLSDLPFSSYTSRRWTKCSGTIPTGLNNMDGGLKMQLPVFGLAPYKFLVDT
ncbi:nuclear receptor corepressor 2 [Gossypium australe]|uniref:Nuclear receptor corepressor 2 n=1 Tax=Gossypium australe TaxID=47621 RepID=A0A5B6WPC6_9ROSI|nr:nuclear receptor corepressor 2 [Gossypium australe]